MERLLDVYRRPYDVTQPVVCMDETPRQLIRKTRTPLAPQPGRLERHDYEYERCCVCNLFMANEPLAGRRWIKVTERKTKIDWAQFIQEIAERFVDAERITLVMDNEPVRNFMGWSAPTWGSGDNGTLPGAPYSRRPS